MKTIKKRIELNVSNEEVRLANIDNIDILALQAIAMLDNTDHRGDSKVASAKITLETIRGFCEEMRNYEKIANMKDEQHD